MTDAEEAQILTKLGELTGELKGVQTALQNGSKKMDALLTMGQENGQRIYALEQAKDYLHKDCVAIHKAVYDGCVSNEVSENKNSKITITFGNLMKLLGFVAVIATCGMVASQNAWG